MVVAFATDSKTQENRTLLLLSIVGNELPFLLLGERRKSGVNPQHLALKSTLVLVGQRHPHTLVLPAFPPWVP